MKDVIHGACRRPVDYPPTTFAIVEAPERIKAGVCLQAAPASWYSDEWIWVNLLFWVDPRYRGTREKLADALFRFIQQWDAEVARPGGSRVVASIETRYHLANKVRLFGRYGTQIGASFLLGELPPETVAGTA